MLQVKFLLVGLLLAAGFVGYQWLAGLPSIPPVRLPVTTGTTAFTTNTAVTAEARADDQLGSLPATKGWGVNGEESPNDVLPTLNHSDDWLRERLAATALPWLAETELVRTSATVLANAARGKVPHKFVEFLAPQGKFAVTNTRGRLIVDPVSYQRYDQFVTSLTSFEPARAAAMFGLIEPLLAEALRELGGDANGAIVTPQELAYQALDIALATPASADSAALVRPKVIYKYADATFEKLVPLQKQLLRMGPDNLLKLRIWLEDFGVALTPGLASALKLEEPPAAKDPVVSSDG